MKWFLSYSLLLIGLLVNAQQEKIESFHSDIKIDTTSTITVTETINIMAHGNEFKRGIVRYLPQQKKDSLGNHTSLNYTILNITKENLPVSYHTDNENGNLVIYVGNANVFIPEGSHQYQITYTAENSISFYKDYDELYWNVNGFGWNFPIDQISATVTLPENNNIRQVACYTGHYGSRKSDCESTFNGNKASFSSIALKPNENLTIAVGFEKGLIPEPPPPSFLEKYGLLLLSLFLSFGLIIYYYITWQKYGIDPHKPTPYPLFDAPNNLSPASVGILHKERYWDDLITASLVNLGVKGYIQIKEVVNKEFLGLFESKNFLISKLKEPSEELPVEEKTLLNTLFANNSNNSVLLDGNYNSKIENAVENFKEEVKFKHKALINEGNNYKFLIFPSLVILGFIALSTYQYMSNIFASFIDLILASLTFAPFIIIFFSKIISRSSIAIKWLVIILIIIFIISFSIFFYSNPINKTNLNLISIIGFILFGATSFIIYQYLIKKPSIEKLKIQSAIEGFEMYLKTAEEKQLQAFNPPDVTPEIFEKYLPYAIALDADAVWGEKFQNYLDKSSINNQYIGSWYIGNNFNPAHFGHTLNSNLSNSISNSATPPSSSGSGSMGGGFSGGGGGGGGGGGW